MQSKLYLKRQSKFKEIQVLWENSLFYMQDILSSTILSIFREGWKTIEKPRPVCTGSTELGALIVVAGSA